MTQTSGIGLYLHIPFCDRLCHYCDFVKTAWHEPADQMAYLRALSDRLLEFLRFWDSYSPSLPIRFDTLFFGGGTPSVFTDAYAPLFEILRPYLAPGAEITLEANPEHMQADRLKIWRDLGFNRLSLGVQSFDAAGLSFLTRTHTAAAALESVQLARESFRNLNIDLIYAWPGQTRKSWQRDLELALSLDLGHLSLYSLTFEGRTPLARRVQRGVLDPLADELQEQFYQDARLMLASKGWVHEEVSNWAKPGFETRHNALYWNGGSYLGIGAGAHSYLEQLGPWGLRFHQGPHWKSFARSRPEVAPLSLQALLAGSEYEIEQDRDAQSWLLEHVSSGLRTARGINLAAICAKTGYSWAPNHVIKMALEMGQLSLDAQHQCRLNSDEWYRETRWALEMALSFVAENSAEKPLSF